MSVGSGSILKYGLTSLAIGLIFYVQILAELGSSL